MVRNEADVIEAFVRHHAEVLDAMIVVDHCSSDGTDELLHALAAEGLPLSVRKEHSLVHRQDVILTALMREAATSGGADWVVPLDADEFLVSREGDARDVLGTLAYDRAWTVDLHYYVPCPDDPVDDNVLKRIRHRRVGESAWWTRKVIVPAARARSGRRSLSQGSHGLVDARTGEVVPASFTDRLALAHFPVRSKHQLARKVLGGWPAHLARPDGPQSGAFQWKRIFDATVSGRLTAQQLQAVALDYPTREPKRPRARELEFDPVPTRVELRYDLPPELAPLEILAETAVRLAEELSDALGGTPTEEERPRTRRAGARRSASRPLQ
jgi:Glycosyl transferase family 2